jgi:hypothetical protein
LSGAAVRPGKNRGGAVPPGGGGLLTRKERKKRKKKVLIWRGDFAYPDNPSSVS